MSCAYNIYDRKWSSCQFYSIKICYQQEQCWQHNKLTELSNRIDKPFFIKLKAKKEWMSLTCVIFTCGPVCWILSKKCTPKSKTYQSCLDVPQVSVGVCWVQQWLLHVVLCTGASLSVCSLWVTVWAPRRMKTLRTSTPFASETCDKNVSTEYIFISLSYYIALFISAGHGIPSRCVLVECCQVVVAMQQKFGSLWGQSPGKQHLQGTSMIYVPVVLKLWLQPHLWSPTLIKPIRKPSKDSLILSAKTFSWYTALFSCCFGSKWPTQIRTDGNVGSTGTHLHTLFFFVYVI